MIQYTYQNNSHYRIDRFEPITVQLTLPTEVSKSFREECINQIVNLYKFNPDTHLALSGGVSSQLILESYIIAGFKPRVLIVKFPGKLNSFDTDPAIESCRRYGIIPLIVEIQPHLLESTYIKELANKYQLYKFLDLVFAHIAETLPIQLFLVDAIDIRKDVEITRRWHIILNESDLWIKRFNQHNTKKVIINRFFTEPHLIRSFLKLQPISDLINNRLHGKISFLSTRKKAFTAAGFNKINAYSKTNTVYYIGKYRDGYEDAFFRSTLFESRKIYIPCKDILTDHGVKKWTFV